jgi:hypothetical protein
LKAEDDNLLSPHVLCVLTSAVQSGFIIETMAQPAKPNLDASMTINDNHSKVSTVTLILAEQYVLYGPVRFMEKGMQNQDGAENSFLLVSV